MGSHDPTAAADRSTADRADAAFDVLADERRRRVLGRLRRDEVATLEELAVHVDGADRPGGGTRTRLRLHHARLPTPAADPARRGREGSRAAAP